MTKLLLACCIPLTALLITSVVSPDTFRARILQPVIALMTPAPSAPGEPERTAPTVSQAPPPLPAPLPARTATRKRSDRFLWRACQDPEPNPLVRQQACAEFKQRLQSSRQSCVQSARSGAAPGYQDANPCDLYARLLQLSQPRPTSRPADLAATQPAPVVRSSSTTRKKPPMPKPRVSVSQCTQHRYGSIRYRQCRADEKQRLIDQCRRTRDELDWTTGDRRQRLRVLARAQCHEADRYQIIR